MSNFKIHRNIPVQRNIYFCNETVQVSGTSYYSSRSIIWYIPDLQGADL